MSYTKTALLEKTIEITREYARGGGDRPLQLILQEIYEKLKELDADTRQV